MVTDAQRKLLVTLYSQRGFGFVVGPQLRVARALGPLVTIADHGYMRGNNERWACSLTAPGYEQARALLGGAR